MKKVLFASFISLLITGAVTLGYFYYQQIKAPQASPLDAIPPDAAFILQINRLHETRSHIHENLFWKDFAGSSLFSRLNEKIEFLDSLIIRREELRDLFENNPVFLSAHLSRSDDFGFLLIFSLPNTRRESLADEIVRSVSGDINATAKRMFDNVQIMECMFASAGKQYTYAVYKGLFIGSFTSFLVEDAIRQLRSGKTFAAEGNFTRIQETTGANADANIYINCRNFSKLLPLYLAENKAGMADRFADLSEWSGFDIKIKPGALILSGFSNCDSAGYFNLVQQQEPQQVELFRILPKRTVFVMYASTEDYKHYFSGLKRKAGDETLRKLNTMNETYDLSLEKSLASWVSKEFALVITEPGNADFSGNTFAIFHTSDSTEARQALFALMKTLSARDNTVPAEEENYKGHPMGYISLRGVIPVLFGNLFSMIDKTFYTIIDNYVIFGNQASSLRSFIDDYSSRKLLINTPDYIAASENLSSRSSLYIYINVPHSGMITDSFLSDSLCSILHGNKEVLKKLSCLTFQASPAKNGMLYTTLSLQYASPAKTGNTLLWSAELDSSVSSVPQIFEDPGDSSRKIVVQDDANVLYIISKEGKILMKDSLPEKIMGTIYPVTLTRKNKTCLLFNTPSSIYLMDTNGEDMKGFPIRLPDTAAAAAPISLFNSGNKKDFRILAPCINKMVYCFRKDGQPSETWTFEKLPSGIAGPVLYFSVYKKEMLALADSAGTIYMLDSNGKLKNRFENQYHTAFLSALYPEKGKSYEESGVIATDTSGTVFHFYMNGKTERQFIRKCSPGYFFGFEDLNADQSKDFIFMNHTQLSAFNQDSTLIFSHDFGQAITQAPAYMFLSNGKGQIGIVSEKAGELYLFADDGSMCPGFPLQGSSPFIVETTGEEGTRILITGSGEKSLYAYTLE